MKCCHYICSSVYNNKVVLIYFFSFLSGYIDIQSVLSSTLESSSVSANLIQSLPSSLTPSNRYLLKLYLPIESIERLL